MVDFKLGLSSPLSGGAVAVLVAVDRFHLVLGGGVGLLLQQAVSLGHAPRVRLTHGGAGKQLQEVA